jgi:hypothetical protein
VRGVHEAVIDFILHPIDDNKHLSERIYEELVELISESGMQQFS